MTTADFIALKDYILERNPYFSNGYANAFRYINDNRILAKDGSGELLAVFPADTLGNYFYLRSEGDLQFSPQYPERLTDNGAQRLTFWMP